MLDDVVVAEPAEFVPVEVVALAPPDVIVLPMPLDAVPLPELAAPVPEAPVPEAPVLEEAEPVTLEVTVAVVVAVPELVAPVLEALEPEPVVVALLPLPLLVTVLMPLAEPALVVLAEPEPAVVVGTTTPADEQRETPYLTTSAALASLLQDW